MSTISDGITLSLRGLSRELGVDRTQLTERIRDSGIQAAGERGGYPVFRLRDVLALILAAAAGEDPEKMCPADRLAFFRSETERVKLHKEQGKLIPVEVFEDTLSLAFKSLTLGLDTMPDVIERDAGLTGRQVDAMQRVIDGQREQLCISLVAQFNE